MRNDIFWRDAHRRVIHWAYTAIRLAGFDVTPISMLEAIRSAPEGSNYTDGYLEKCILNAERRRRVGQLRPGDGVLVQECAAFWACEWANMAENTRSCIKFHALAVLEQKAYGYERPDFLDPHDNDDWEYHT